MLSRFLVVATLFFLTTSCGYHVSNNLTSHANIHVPSIKEDPTGVFISQLTKELCFYGVSCKISQHPTSDCIKISVSPPSSEHIGFTYILDSIESDSNSILVSNEGRLTIKADILIPDQDSIKKISENNICLESVLYDFEPDISSNSNMQKSMGQVTINDEAVDIAIKSAYRKLAKQVARKIIYAIC